MRPKKSLGQNFLNDKNILTKIIDCGKINKNDIILEIGPGTGNLTEKIVEKKPKHIIVVEKDKELSKILKDKFGNQIEIINKDILNCFNDIEFKTPIKVFGNLPYNISTKILTSYIKVQNLEKKYNKFIFIFQKEVANRILAKENSKDYGRLSILASWKLDKYKVIDLDPKIFYPKPKVWSSLIVFSPKLEFENLKKAQNLENITNIFFNQRRKMIKKPMKQLFDNFEEIAQKLEINLNLRPQNISLKQYIEICKSYENLI